jgi:FkbM family methyltransferase
LQYHAAADEATDEGFIEVSLVGVPRPILVRNGRRRGEVDDRETIWELFFDDHYTSPMWRSNQRVLDLGANIGMLPIWLQANGMRPSVYVGVEPDPVTASLLRQQVARLPFEHPPHIVQAAVGDADREVRFVTQGNSMSHRVGDDGDLSVRMRPVGDLLDEADLDEVDIMKLDVEGGEREVVADAGRWASRVAAIACELHDGMDGAWLNQHLRPHGYRVFDYGDYIISNHAALREDMFEKLPKNVQAKAMP